MKQIDPSLAEFEKYKLEHKEYIEKDLSESDTRSKLIDKLLIDVLGWAESDIKREGHVDSGYYDYKVSIPGFVFIVEAKRQFKELKLPSSHDKVSIKTLLKENAEVIEQIRNYAMDEGVAYGVITNGYQFIILKLINTDGKPWKDNYALVFKGIDDIDSRFIEFYDNLSKFSIIHNGGFRFDLPINAKERPTILSTLLDKDKELIRNSLSAVLAPLIDQVFGEMFSTERQDDSDFIRSCFVENAETKKYKNEIERLFNDKAPDLANVIPIVNSDNLANSIVGEINREEITIQNNYPPKPIIIIGSKGAGKTTFINHLFKYRFDENLFKNQFIIYIDFRKFYESHTSFEPPKIATEILESIYSNYEKDELHKLEILIRIYIKQIKRNDESIWSYDKRNNLERYNITLSTYLEEAQKDSLEHLKNLSLYLIREKRKRLVVVIDNADQFNDEIQEKIFVFSHSLTRSTLCGTVISLREGYYRKWQNSPPFDAYESNIYHITAPRYMEILQRRIEFAINTVKENKNKYSLSVGTGKEVTLSQSYIEYFLKGLQDSLFVIQDSALLDFVSRTTFPNLREGLRIIKIFLTSGHTKVSEYIARERSREKEKEKVAGAGIRQIIPFHEFIKSIALQNRHYYNSQISVIFNLFIPPKDSNDHFIRFYILKDFAEIIDSVNHTEKFIKNVDIIEKFTSLGYKINIINAALFDLIDSSLLDTDEQLSDIEWDELPSHYNITITAKGFYYLKELLYRFHYYDLIGQDTPIFDDSLYNKLYSIFPVSSEEGGRNFNFRIEFAKLFIDYLEKMESLQASQIKAVYGNVVAGIKAKVLEEINRM